MTAARDKITLPYREGEWFAVPLRKGGYALGLVARMNGKGKVLGYFFGPKRERVPTLSDTTELRSADAVYVRFFGDLGLIDGKWAILGKSDLWQRAAWPMPTFCRHSEFDTHAYRVEYSEKTLAPIQETEISPEDCRKLPRDGLSGFGAIEITLTKLLSP